MQVSLNGKSRWDFIQMRIKEGHSYADIEKELGLSKDYLKVWVSRNKKKYTQEIQPKKIEVLDFSYPMNFIVFIQESDFDINMFVAFLEQYYRPTKKYPKSLSRWFATSEDIRHMDPTSQAIQTQDVITLAEAANLFEAEFYLLFDQRMFANIIDVVMGEVGESPKGIDPIFTPESWKEDW